LDLRERKYQETGNLLNKELPNIYSLPNIIRVIKSRRTGWVEHVACMGEGRSLYKILVQKPEGSDDFGHSLVDNIKMGSRGMVCWNVNWIYVT
jgi:hypothetical protein